VLASENRIVSNVTRNSAFFQLMKSPIARNAQCWFIFAGHSVHKKPDVNKKVMFQHMPTSVFDRVGVRIKLCVHYGYCSRALLSTDEMEFIVQILSLQ